MKRVGQLIKATCLHPGVPLQDLVWSWWPVISGIIIKKMFWSGELIIGNSISSYSGLYACRQNIVRSGGMLSQEILIWIFTCF